MTQSTGILDIPDRVMEGSIRSGPLSGVCPIEAMTGFTAISTEADDTDVEAWVAAGPAGLGMARLAVQHAVRERRGQPLGGRPMVGRKQEAAIYSVGGQRTPCSEILQVHRQSGIA